MAALMAGSGAVLVLAVSCSARPAGVVEGSVVAVSVRDFRVVSVPARMPAGWVTLRVRNRGPDTHELLIVRAAAADGRLPLRRDGVTVDEDALKARTVGSVDGVQAGRDRVLRLRLAAGRYELFCNMAGHYLTGMHTVLIVTAAA